MTTIGHARQAVATAAAKTEFYRLWHTGQRMGASHLHMLEMMGKRSSAPSVEQLRLKLLAGTQQRRTIASIVKENAALLQPFEAAVLIFGEESGTLEQSLATLVTHFKAEHRLLLKVWSKLTYPLIVSLAFVVIAPLPLVFQGQARAYWISVVSGLAIWYSFGGAVIVGLAAKYANRREFVLARLARALAAGVEAGLPLDRVVTLAANSTGHPGIMAHLRKLTARQLATQPISGTFSGCMVIPAEMVAAMRVAEVSGDFSGALRKLADLYDST
ncbi:MAG: type II secretion system F family protein [Gemmatimonadota bacterium]